MTRKAKSYWLGGIAALPILAYSVLKHHDPFLITLGTFALFLICVVVNLFVGIYFSRPWRETRGGEAIMYAMGSLAVLADLSLITTFLGPNWEWRGALRLFIFGGILIAHVRLLYVLLTINESDTRIAHERDDL